MLKTTERRSTNHLFSSLFTNYHTIIQLGTMLGWVLAELMIAHPTYSFQGEMFQLATRKSATFPPSAC